MKFTELLEMDEEAVVSFLDRASKQKAIVDMQQHVDKCKADVRSIAGRVLSVSWGKDTDFTDDEVHRLLLDQSFRQAFGALKQARENLASLEAPAALTIPDAPFAS